MKNAIKLGFGITVGVELAKIVVQLVSELIVDTAAKNEKFMNRAKESDPKLYENLKERTAD